jgi:hypothetical protein
MPADQGLPRRRILVQPLLAVKRLRAASEQAIRWRTIEWTLSPDTI